MTPFHAATLKLTAWYLAILMTVSIAFSVVIYSITAHELDRPLPPEAQQNQYFDDERMAFRQARIARAIESKQTVVTNLVIMNVVTLALGAGASYLFARRTLRPIEEAMEAQSRFVSDASHELRTPLAAMRIENEIALRDKKPTVKELQTLLGSNLEEVERLQLLTDRLLALSSKQELPLGSFNVQDAVADAAARHDAAAQLKHIKITNQTQPLTAHGHGETVSDIVSILLDNAIKYSPEHTAITLTVREQNHRVYVDVADQGSGITDEEKHKIFERFYRSDVSRSKQNVEGHGLGLALACRLAELNNAKLTVEDNAPTGARFILDLAKA